MQPVLSVKFAYRIRTRHGLLVERLTIQGRDEADAEKKLRQMYQHCEVLECTVLAATPRKADAVQFKELVSIAGK